MREVCTLPSGKASTIGMKKATDELSNSDSISGYKGGRIKRKLIKEKKMSKMGQISAEMDEKNVPEDKRNSLINRVSAGMHSAEKRIDFVVKSDGAKEEVKVEKKSPASSKSSECGHD